MKTRDYLDEYANEAYRKSWNGGGEITERMQEIIKELEASIRKEAVESILEMGEIHMNDGMWVYHGKIKEYALSKGITLK